MKTYIVGTHKKSLTEALLMSTHNIRFHAEEKYLPNIPSYLEFLFVLCSYILQYLLIM